VRPGVFNWWESRWFCGDFGEDMEVLGHLHRPRLYRNVRNGYATTEKRGQLTSDATESEAVMRECTMGYDVPRSLATFRSEMTRSYAIILLCICNVKLGETFVLMTQSAKEA
jgi:hypothetical protein